MGKEDGYNKDNYKPGEIVLFSSGAYSDYSVMGIVQVEKEFSFREQLLKFKSTNDDKGYNGKPFFHADKFYNFLSINELVSDIVYSEIHLGDYGEVPEVSK